MERVVNVTNLILVSVENRQRQQLRRYKLAVLQGLVLV
jgi:hypothetical protein